MRLLGSATGQEVLGGRSKARRSCGGALSGSSTPARARRARFAQAEFLALRDAVGVECVEAIAGNRRLDKRSGGRSVGPECTPHHPRDGNAVRRDALRSAPLDRKRRIIMKAEVLGYLDGFVQEESGLS